MEPQLYALNPIHFVLAKDMTSRWNQIVLVGWGILLISLSFQGCEGETNHIYFTLSDAKGLKQTDQVKLDGKTVGEVREMKLVKNQILAEIILEDEIKIPKEFSLRICPINLLGDKEMQLTGLNPSETYWQRGDTIQMDVQPCEGESDQEINENLRNMMEMIEDVLE